MWSLVPKTVLAVDDKPEEEKFSQASTELSHSGKSWKVWRDSNINGLYAAVFSSSHPRKVDGYVMQYFYCVIGDIPGTHKIAMSDIGSTTYDPDEAHKIISGIKLLSAPVINDHLENSLKAYFDKIFGQDKGEISHQPQLNLRL